MRPLPFFSLLFFVWSFSALSCLSASERPWEQADFAMAKFDPAEVLNPDTAPRSEWARKLRQGDKAGAARALVAELRSGPSRIDFEESIPVIRLRWFGVAINNLGGTGFNADDVVNLRYVGTYGIEHQFEGEIDWTYDGSHGKTPEWTWQMNRHLHWINLADAYLETGDAKYARAWERELRSWIAQVPRPDDAGNRRGSAWRTLDTGIRAGSTWPYAFEIFRNSPHVSDEALWLFFTAQRENAVHLQKYPTGGNWKIMETNGLGHVGLMFPELKDAELFVSTALQRAQDEIAAQFFPDGTHQEFAPHYAAAGCITNFYALARLADRNNYELPEGFWDSLAHLVNALARIADPDGIAPGLHNSLPIDINQLYADVVAGRSDQEATTPPWAKAESDLLPYGGYAVFRRNDTYALFNAGPRGTAHYHDDDLQLLTYFQGHHFAVDPGQPRYTDEPLSRYLRTSPAHNVVLMNGQPHEPAVKIQRPRKPMPISFHGSGAVQIAAAKRALLQGEGAQFEHERVVLDVEDFGWIVFDRLIPPDEEPKTWEWIWQMPVDSAEASDFTATASYHDGPAMALVVATSATGEFTVTKGQAGEEPRGWMNQRGALEYIPIPAFRFITGETTGAVWTVTVHAPFASAGAVKEIDLYVSSKNFERWTVIASRGDDEIRAELTGREEIREIRTWKNGEPGETFAIGDHALRP